MSITLLILGLLLFVGLVVIHELGHFIVARWGGVVAEEFGIGFPPKAWGKRVKSPRGDYDFTLNWLPLGGFVRLKGEHDADTHKGSFGAASLSTKVKIMTAGVIMNLTVAIVLFTVVAWLGMPQFIDNQFTVASDTKTIRQELLVGYVEPGSPAQRAGLQTKDRLIAVGPKAAQTPVLGAKNFPSLTKKYAGKPVVITYERNNQQRTATATLRSTQEVEKSKQTDTPKGYLGVSPTEYVLNRSTWSAPVVGVGLATQFTSLTLKGIGTAVGSLFKGDTKTASEQVSGPVGIFVVLKDGSLLGYQFILFIVALISLTLAIMNVLPIPALDGGRLFVTLLYRVLRKPLTPVIEDRIHGTGFVALMALFLLITVIDIRRFF